MIHPAALVHPEAQVDKDVEIGPWCTIGPHVKIGAGTRLMSHVVVEGWTTIGKNNSIFPFSVLGGVPQDLKYKGEKTELIVGDNNTIRESVTLNLGTAQGGALTKVGNHNLIMANSHLGHDCNVGDHCIIANYGGLAGHVTLEDYVTLAGMIGVSQFVRVGAHSYVWGQSGLERDVPPFTIAVGARQRRSGRKYCGLRRRGYPTRTIQKINEAIKLWMRPDVQKSSACLRSNQYGGYKEIRQFIAFIRKAYEVSLDKQGGRVRV